MANFNFNRVMLGGRLTADPENRQTETGVSMTRFSIAVNRRYSKDSAQQQVDFFNVVAWRATADFVSKFFKKGSSIFVVGTIQNRSWTDNEGNKRYATDIVAEEVNFVDS
ncbi:MAG: single-stranded DNA-binding protein, partial [Clostridia bacterium]|nr:single-stranded DNA-binding protein [Clostridia bacterium]